MTVREMHIEIDQCTQLVAANRTRKWYPEEKDWVLNKMMLRLIENSLIRKPDNSGGFELDQSKVDAIKNLIKTRQELTAYIDSPTRYKCFLPADYLFLLSDASYTKPNCGEPDPEVINSTQYITRLLQEKSDKVTPSYYEEVNLLMQGVNITIPDNLPYNNDYAGYPEVDDISFLVPYILWKTGLRWERYAGLYYPGHYIGVTNTNPSNPSVEVDGTIFNEFSISTLSLSRHTESTHKHHNNRLTASNLISGMLPTAFFKPSYISPISELEKDILWIYRDNSFTVSKTEISYICKPQPISLSLGTDCELGETVHQKLCDLAVEYMQNRVKDLKGVQLSEADIVKRINL